MGATCACALIVGDRLYIAYVGDSRIYLMRNGMIQQISVDHTWVQEAIEAGILDPDLGKDHPNAHVIRRYLGSKQPVDPDTRLRLSPREEGARSEANQGLHLRPNDHVILSSDGLTDLVSDEEIKAALDQLGQEEALSKLVDMANQRGGHDNITIVDLLVPENLPEATQPISRPPAPARRKRARWVLPAVLLLLVVLLLAAVAGAIYYMTSTISQVTATPTSRAVATQPAVIPSVVATTPENTPSIPGSTTPATIAVSTSTSGLVTPFVTLTPWPTNVPAQ
jgi:protein phosphatase